MPQAAERNIAIQSAGAPARPGGTNMPFFPTCFIQAARLLSLAAFASAPAAIAQSFEQDEWRFAASNPAPERPLQYTHLLDRDPNESDVVAALVDGIYPTNLEAADLKCDLERDMEQVYEDTESWLFGESVITEFEVTQDFVDDLLARFAHAASWLDAQGFAPIETYARMPEYERVEGEGLLGLSSTVSYVRTGETINLVGCDPGTVYFATYNDGTTTSANTIRFGHSAAELREANPLAFRLTSVHEFLHVYTNNFAPAFTIPGRDPHWFSEGLPDAIAIRYVADTEGGYSSLLAHDDIAPWRPQSEAMSARYSKRFYLARPYFVPLNLTAIYGDGDSSLYNGASEGLIGAVTELDYRGMGYITNGFWTHVMERYLDDDPSTYHDLLQNVVSDVDRLMEVTDGWLDSRDGQMTGIEHVFPQFLAEYEGWWENRVDYNAMSEMRWLDYGFDGCEEIELTQTESAGLREVEVALNAGRCFDVILASPVAALKPGVDIAVYAEGEPEIANHLYLALARVRNADTVGGTPHPGGINGHDWSCYELIESGDMPRGGCLLDPEQGRIEWSDGNSQTARTFNVSEVGNSGVRNVRLRFILSYVDSGNVEVGTDMAAQDVTIVVAPSYVELDEGSEGSPKSRTRNQPAPDDETEYTLVYGVHAGGLGLPASGGGLPGMPDLAGMNIPGMERVGEVLDEARQMGPRSLVVIEERPDGQARTVGFQFEEPPVVGETGPISVTGVYNSSRDAMARRVSGQDPDTPSELTIEEHTDHTLRFRGRVHACVIDAARLLQGAHICRDGERVSFAMRGAVGFPGIASGETSYTHVSTPELEAYQNLRGSRVAGILGSNPGLGGGPAPSGPPARSDPAPADSPGPQAGQAPDPGRQSSIPEVDPDCDCSCEGLARIRAVRGDAGLTSQEAGCARQCGATWMFCESP